MGLLMSKPQEFWTWYPVDNFGILEERILQADTFATEYH